MVYFLIGATHKSNEQAAWADIEKHVLSSGLTRQGKGKLYSAEISRFKLGNLDQLMFINDNLIKQDAVVEGLLKKIERQYLDITEKNSHEFNIEYRDAQLNIESYLMSFKWDDTRFPRNQVLPDVLKGIQQRTNQIDDNMRQKIQQYQDVRNQSQQIAKKEGNLLSKEMVDVLKDPIVKPRDFVYTDYLTTVVAIVPKGQIPEWLACYEFLSENVVPKSAKQFQVEDKDNLTVWRVVLMKVHMDKELVEEEIPEENTKKKVKQGPVDEFITRARDKLRITVREFEYKPQESRDRDKQRIDLKTQSDNLTNTLKQTCEKMFSDLYVSYIHLKNLRLVIDIAMRFGTFDPNFTCIIKPETGKEKKVQQLLLKLFADPSQVGLYGTKEELEDTEDFFPFVYIPINIP